MKLPSLCRFLAVALLSGLASFAALADNPVNGKTLYDNRCANCHGSSPLTQNFSRIYNGRNARSAIDAAIGNVGDMNSLRSAFPAGGSALADVAAYIGNTPTALHFASTAVGSTAPAQTVTVYASFKSGKSISAMTVATSGDYARTGGTCGTTVGTGSSCTVQVAFTPTAAGTRSGTLSITHSNTLTPVTIALSGTATGGAAAPVASLTAALDFGSANVGSTSASKTATLTNSGNAPLVIGTLASSNAQFVINGGTCAAGGSVAAAGSCSISLGFRPTGSGARSASLVVTHNAAGGSSSTSLSGTGVALNPVIGVAPASLSFSQTVHTTSAAKTVTISNSGNAALTLNGLTLSGAQAADFQLAAGTTCVAGGSVAANGSCVVRLSFTPGATGTRSASLAITHNAAGSPSSVSLSGTGTAAAEPALTISPTALTFAAQAVGSTSALQSLSLRNSGAAPLVLNGLAVSGSAAADYARSGTCTASSTLAVGASCTVSFAFTPAAAGARSATLTVTHNAPGGSSSASLSGAGVATKPVIAVAPTSLSFSQTVHTTSAAQTVTVANNGNAVLSLGTLTLAGAQAADFQIAAGSTCAAGGSVAANASCVLKLSFTPGATGARHASLVIAHNAAGATSSVALGGTGTAAPAAAISLNAASIDFGAQTVGSTSASRSVTVSNSGAAPLTFSALTLAGDAAADYGRAGTCTPTGTLAVGASCSVAFTFTPGALGNRVASLTLVSNASNGNAVLGLSGSGAATVEPAVALAPMAIAFGDQSVGLPSTARSVRLTNTGTGALNLGAIGATASFTVSHDCGTSLAAGAHCTLSVGFTPSVAGAASGSVDVTSNAAGSPHHVSLTGTGVVSSSVLAWSPAVTQLEFDEVGVGADPALATLTLVNQGPVAVTLTQIARTGPQAGDFSLGADSSCAANMTLAAGARCAVVVAFHPAAVGERHAVLHVVSTGTNPPDVALSGEGHALAHPTAALTPQSLSFEAPADGSPVGAQTVTLQSTGNAVLHVTALRIASGAFAIETAPTNGCPVAPFELAPGSHCAVGVRWTGTDIGTGTGALEFDTDAAAAPLRVALEAERASGPEAEPPKAAGSGGGGCSIAQGHTPADPTLWLLAVLAAAVLWRRRSGR